MAFLTIQEGADALKPGDCLVIGPGEYSENVRVHQLGDQEQDTVIRAEEPGTVLLRGERDADLSFQPVPGRRFTHVATCDGMVLAVLETDSLALLQLAPTVTEVDFGPGRYFHDAVAKKLYLSSTDFQPPGRHHYKISVRKGHGLEINESRRVVVDGLAASGFMEPVEKRVLSYPVSGFMIRHSERCVVRRCVAFFSRSGITINNGSREDQSPGGNRVEHCRLYGNVEGLVAHHPGDELFCDSHSFLNSTYGARFYGARRRDKTCRFQRLVAWGNPGGDYWFKGRGLSSEATHARADQCVAFKDSHILAYSQGIKGARDYRGNTGPTTMRLPDGNRQFHELMDREFADPFTFDFRPQATATITEPGKDYEYQGPYPYRANIRYLSSDGSDQNDGLSMTQAWKTLDHAVKGLRPGDTLYFAAGRYRLSMALTELSNVSLRGRGLETPVVDGPLTATGCHGLSIQRIHWTGPVRIVDSVNVTLDNCVLTGKVVEARGVKGLRVTHNLMSVPLKLRKCDGVDLRGNLYATVPGVRADGLVGIRYSGYNGYPHADAVWEVAGKRITLDELRESQHDVHSRVVASHESHDLAGRGPLGTALGPWRAWRPQSVQLIGPFVHSTTDTTANVEWWTTHPVKTRVRWGDTPECRDNSVIDQASFFSHSLTGLQPGKTYYIKVEPISLNAAADPARRIQPLSRGGSVLQVTTALKPSTPRTLYVATTGNDSHDGASLRTAWRTLQHAADNVRPGDHVLISGGEYPGAVYFRTTGALDKPITFQAAPGERVVISGMRERLRVGFVLYDKSHYRFDALYFEGFAGIPDNKGLAECSALLVHGGRDLQITRCHFSLGWGPAIRATYTRDILLRNSAFFNSMTAIIFSRCPGLRVENNVFAHALIHHLLVYATPTAKAQFVRNNIFCENTRGKTHLASAGLGKSQSNNCFFTRWPGGDRRVLGGGGVTGGLTLPEYCIKVGPTDSFHGNPQFPGLLGYRQGWGPGYVNKDFNGLFATNPELVRRGVGLQPEAFRDFHFWKEDWPYDRAWADKLLARMAAAEAGDDRDALAAYLALIDDTRMDDQLKSDLLDCAAQCADRLDDFDQALALAKRIPTPVLSCRRQMARLHSRGKFAELIGQFADQRGRGTFHLNWRCPDDERPLADVLYYRGIAYAEIGELKQAEKDLRIMVDKGLRLGYSPGPSLLDLSWKRLGDFYRDYLKDDAKALESYAQVLSRTTVYHAERPMPKPVLSGSSEVLGSATKAACAILRRQGKEGEARKWEIALRRAQEEAMTFLKKAESADNTAGSSKGDQ